MNELVLKAALYVKEFKFINAHTTMYYTASRIESAFIHLFENEDYFNKEEFLIFI